MHLESDARMLADSSTAGPVAATLPNASNAPVGVAGTPGTAMMGNTAGIVGTPGVAGNGLVGNTPGIAGVVGSLAGVTVGSAQAHNASTSCAASTRSLCTECVLCNSCTLFELQCAYAQGRKVAFLASTVAKQMAGDLLHVPSLKI